MSFLKAGGRTIALMACLSVAGQAMLVDQAFAQARKPAQQAPAAGGAPAAPPQPQGPIKVDLKASKADWTKVCGKDQGNGKEVCYTTRDFGSDPTQPPAIALAIYDIKGDDTRIIRLLMPVGLLLRPGFRFSVDKGPTVDGAFEICMPNGCFAESKVKGAMIEQMKKGSIMNVAVKNSANNEVNFTLPIAGFGAAFDGPAIDPKVLQARQEELARQLEEKAKAQQQVIEQQQQQQQQGGAAPAAPAQQPAK